MRRSKLSIYVDILNVLAQRGPLKITPIMCEAKVNFNLLKKHLCFLINQGLIVKNEDGKSWVYSNTVRGTAVLKFFAGTKTPQIEDDVLPVPN